MNNVFAQVAVPAIQLWTRKTRRGTVKRSSAGAATTLLDIQTFLQQSFRATGALPTRFVVRHYSEIEARGITVRELQCIRKNLECYCTLQALNTTVICKALPSHTSNAVRLAIIIRMTGDSVVDMRMAIHRVQLAVQRLGDELGVSQEPNISAYVSGIRAGKFTRSSAEEIVSAGLWAVHAKHIEGIVTDDMVSISAHAPRGPRTIHTDGRCMNLQIATHYDADKHRTEVTVGTPIIVDAY